MYSRVRLWYLFWLKLHAVVVVVVVVVVVSSVDDDSMDTRAMTQQADRWIDHQQQQQK
jgi:hypothetical protein